MIKEFSTLQFAFEILGQKFKKNKLDCCWPMISATQSFWVCQTLSRLSTISRYQTVVVNCLIQQFSSIPKEHQIVREALFKSGSFEQGAKQN